MSEPIAPEVLAGARRALPPTRDRLLTTTFLVGSLHALVILGVTFSPPRGGGASSPASLEVLVVHDPVPEAELNKDADYLAQVNQHGSGTGRDVRGAESPRAAATDADNDGSSESGRRGRPDRGRGDADVLSTRAPSRDQRHFATMAAAGAPMSPLVLQPLSGEADGADSGSTLQLKGAPLHELMVTANTRESSVAVYLDRWRHRIERIGAANYPLDAVRRAGYTGSPVLEVELLASGKLLNVTVKRSSGYLTLDQAALNILRLSAPFEPFPRPLAAKHDALRISYEWQFLGGDATQSTVRMPADTR